MSSTSNPKENLLFTVTSQGARDDSLLGKTIRSATQEFTRSENKSDFLLQVMPHLVSFTKSDSYSPEEIVCFLSSFPRHASQTARFMAMEEYLSKHPNTSPSEVMAEAAIKLVILHQQLEILDTELQKEISKINWRIELLDKALKNLLSKIASQEIPNIILKTDDEFPDNQKKIRHDSIERIEEEYTNLKSEIYTKTLESNKIKSQILLYMDEMTGIIVFFDAYQSYLKESQDEKLFSNPIFVDDDLALRLIDRQKK